MNNDVFYHELQKTYRYNFEHYTSLAHEISNTHQATFFDSIASHGARRIGYIVATCSPVTRAHIELAQQAADRLKLDTVLFIIWPFHYIEGFHAKPLDSWIKSEHHIPWEMRVELLEAALRDSNNQRLGVLKESKAWYEKSTAYFNQLDPHSFFWTGTWYVIRRLQMLVNLADPMTDFVFICGADQYNPNVLALERGGSSEKVWKDYSLIEQLSIHDMFVAPRDDGRNTIIPVSIPECVTHHVIIGEKVLHSKVSATRIRQGMLSLPELETVTFPSVVQLIRQHHLWGFS